MNLIRIVLALFSFSSSKTSYKMSASKDDILELNYFGLFAKVASLIALEHSGLTYRFKTPESWKDMKPNLKWGCLPCLKNLPSEHIAAFGGGELGQEIAILNYIAARSPEKMKGIDLSEELISHQLYGEGEDIYQALVKIKGKMVSDEAAIAFFSKDQQDATSDCQNFGIYVFLDLLEKFIKECGKEGRFTTSGCTVGECKLWASLHCVYLIDPTVLDGFDGMKKFYTRFLEEKATQAIIKGQRTEGALAQYFVKPDVEQN
mmetsp:Transcript_30628/g.46701  ORF Transcript_30628/g.46701 Transcript_30628/m.46701 type:complete len:261 (-) Transcript_30628:1087-1869(-)